MDIASYETGKNCRYRGFRREKMVQELSGGPAESVCDLTCQ